MPKSDVFREKLANATNDDDRRSAAAALLIVTVLEGGEPEDVKEEVEAVFPEVDMEAAVAGARKRRRK